MLPILETVPTVAVCAAVFSGVSVHMYHSGGLSKCSLRKKDAKSDGSKIGAKKASDLNVRGLSVAAADESTRSARFPFSMQEASERGTVIDVHGEPVDLGNETAILLGGVLGFNLAFWLSGRLRSPCKNISSVPPAMRTTSVSSRSDTLVDCQEMVSVDPESSFQKAFEVKKSVTATPSSSPFSDPVQRTMSVLRAAAEDASFSGLSFSDGALNELGVSVEHTVTEAEFVTSRLRKKLGNQFDQPSLTPALVARSGSDENDTNMATLSKMSRRFTCMKTQHKMPESMTSSVSVRSPPCPLLQRTQTVGYLDPDTLPAPVQEAASCSFNTCDHELATGKSSRLMNCTQSLSAQTLYGPVCAPNHPEVAQSSPGVADRITRAEERYHRARERLHGASSCRYQSKTKSYNADRDRAETFDSQTADVVVLHEVARKVEAALARSQISKERMQTAARKAVRDRRDNAAKVREDWSKASSSRAPSWHSSSDLDLEARVHLGLGAGDQAKGKSDMFDGYMRSLSLRDKGDAFELVHDLEIDKGHGHFDDSSSYVIHCGVCSPSESSRTTAHPASSHGALALSLIGDAREGETLSVIVPGFVAQPGTNALSVRWQRGSVPCRTGEGSWPPSLTFRTILGAKSMSYTLTRADVRSVIRVAVALISKSTEVTDNKVDDRWSKYAFGAAITEIVVQPR
jgi:hypothetical protein